MSSLPFTVMVLLLFQLSLEDSFRTVSNKDHMCSSCSAVLAVAMTFMKVQCNGTEFL